MPVEVSDDRLVIRLDTDDPIELDGLSEGFSALARQYQKTLSERGSDEERAKAKLYITRLKSGSVEVEIAGWIYTTLLAMDYVVIFSDFSNRIKTIISFFAGIGAKPDKIEQDDVRDFERFLRPIAGRRGSKLKIKRARYHKKTKRREILAEYEFKEDDLSNAFAGLQQHELLLEGDEVQTLAKDEIKRDVILRWHQTNVEDGKIDGRTGDRGIVDEITDKPLPVLFLKDSIAKQKMTGGHLNPFRQVYRVDINIRYSSGKPAAYIILELHEILSLKDSDAPQGDLL